MRTIFSFNSVQLWRHGYNNNLWMKWRRSHLMSTQFFKTPSRVHGKNHKNYFFLNYLNIVGLQCCVSFKCTAEWISYTYIHSYSSSFPIYVITEYWVEFLVWYSSFLLVICLYIAVVLISDNWIRFSFYLFLKV